MNSLLDSVQAAKSRVTSLEGRAVWAGCAAAGSGWLLLRLIPQLELGLFARGAAWLAGFFTGAPILRVEEGWMLAGSGQPVVITTACSATGYFLIVATLVSWQLARHGKSPGRAAVTGFCAALPLAILLNALRVVTVTQAHRWLIPRLPEAYGPFLHMLTGAAIFLPALITLNLLLEIHGRPRTSVRS